MMNKKKNKMKRLNQDVRREISDEEACSVAGGISNCFGKIVTPYTQKGYWFIGGCSDVCFDSKEDALAWAEKHGARGYMDTVWSYDRYGMPTCGNKTIEFPAWTKFRSL